MSRTHGNARHRSIRSTLLTLALVPCIALAGFWGATTSRVLQEGLDLRNGSKAGRLLESPAIGMFYNLQRERALTAVWLADPTSTHAALDKQRLKTDAALRTMSGLSEALKNAPARARTSFQPLADALRQFPLQALRAGTDSRSVSDEWAVGEFTQLIDLEVEVVTAVSVQVDDGSLVVAAEPLGLLVNAAEQIQQANTVLAPAVATGRLTASAQTQFAMAVGTQRFLLTSLSARLSGESRMLFEKVTGSAAWKRMVSIENAVLSQQPAADRTGSRPVRAADPPAWAAAWSNALWQVTDDLEQFTQKSGQILLARQTARGNQLMREAITVGAGGLVAVVVVSLLSWRLSRSLLRRMAGLRRATLELAVGRLPTLVDRLNRNETVDVAKEAPELDYGDDELGQVVKAFNSAQLTAVRSVVALADMRHGLENAIVGVARRTQNLVNRQLTLLDTLERKHEEPDVLKDLYELDSHASQMRRYQENLVIMTGAHPGRRFTEPVSIVDVLRSAVGDVADYQRVILHADYTLQFAPHVVADIIRLVTELVDNAATFSPPVFPVSIEVALVSRGLVIEIEDRGFGMSDDAYAEANRKLTQPPLFDVFALAEDARVGLFVVARLAAKHGIRTTLRPSPFGGMSAIVLVPAALVVGAPPLEELGGAGQDAADDSESPPPLSAQGPLTKVESHHSSASPSRRLPRRVPQKSPIKEVRSGATAPGGPDRSPGSPVTAERLARTMSAFQRGTTHARDLGGQHPRNTSLPPKES
ncbi:nitrate- and nitrite sensing domain-containing protein [Streptomyces sp. MMS24-I31]|uniref:sensor histidine kinase n=1 Tax=Streptomyces sp. MMS24-I31 TaxID=3351563 RepID=UPI0038968BB8